MRLRIHHGAAEIGGNCIELESGGRSLLLDLGLPLDSAPKLPPVPGLTTADRSLLGVVLSHPHLDHYGLLPQVRQDLPVWLGRGAKRLLAAAAPFTAGAALPQTVTPYDTDVPFIIGPFRITPYLMDHSAFDAHALLIEADGKTVFYSGDFRGHGRERGVFERFLAAPPRDVDVLLMEGTTIGRTGAAASEQEVEDDAAALMRECPGLALTCFSGQNIERFMTVYQAAVRSERTFVIDAYMANLIDALSLATLPDVRADRSLRVYLPRSQRRMIIAGKRFDLIDRFASRRIYQDELLAAPQRFAMMFRTSMIGDLARADLAGGSLLYSLWPGYLDRDRVDLRSWTARKGVSFHIIHSSGHACTDDLQRLAVAISPRRLVPIHSATPESYAGLFENVQRVNNGEWLGV